MISEILLATMILFFFETSYADKIFQWKDDSGQIHFGYEPPLNTKSKKIKVKTENVFDKAKIADKCTRREYLIGDWLLINKDRTFNKGAMAIREYYRYSSEKKHRLNYVAKWLGRIAHQGSWSYSDNYIYFKRKQVGSTVNDFPNFNSALIIRANRTQLHIMTEPRNTLKFIRDSGKNNSPNCITKK